MPEPKWTDWKVVNPELHRQSEAVRASVLAVSGEGFANGGAVLRGMMLALADLRHNLAPPGMLVTEQDEMTDLIGLINAFAQVRQERF